MNATLKQPPIRPTEEFVTTSQAEQARQMCEVVLNARAYSRVGQITGDPGTGKSSVTQWLNDEFSGIRIECWAGMGRKHMLQELLKAYDARFNVTMPLTGSANTLFQRMKDVENLNGLLIIADEANHLTWNTLESLRGLSDRGAGVILAGTGVLSRTLNLPQVQIYTAQIRQRIGAKHIIMKPVGNADELAAYVLAPRFTALTKAGARKFHEETGGNWRTAIGLADACERLMINENIDKFDQHVVATAAAWLAENS